MVTRTPDRGRGLDPGLVGSTGARPWSHALESRRRHGQSVADQFLACYETTIGIALHDQPYWDLVSLLDLLLDGDDPGDIEPLHLQRFEAYAATVLARRE